MGFEKEKRERVKKVLIVATVFKFLGFEKNNIKILKSMGYEIHCAANLNQAEWLKDDGLLDDIGIIKHQVDFERNPLSKQNINAYRQLKCLIKKYHFTLIHCHTPVAAALTRIAAIKSRKHGTKVIYTAHGFHFFQGAPLKNWMLYYPVEKILSWWTDCLITINKEDYKRAKKKFHAKRTEYVSGVGVDTQKFFIPDKDLEIKKQKEITADKSSIIKDYEKADTLQKSIVEEESSYITIRQEKRKELGVHQDDFVIVSVGELNANKNHRVIIEAVKQLNDRKIKYIVCGMGELKEELEELIKKERLEKQVFLLGYREDIREILWVGDLFAFPSKREGLPVALMEAMASGIPCIASDIRGNRDLFGKERKKYLLSPIKPEAWENSIKYCMQNQEKIIDITKENYKRILDFSKTKVVKKMRKIYQELGRV